MLHVPICTYWQQNHKFCKEFFWLRLTSHYKNYRPCSILWIFTLDRPNPRFSISRILDTGNTTMQATNVLYKIWGFHGGDYEEWVFWDITTLFVLHRRHYVSVTESSRFRLCRIWGFHGCDYEECRLLGYKNPVRTTQETHYFSATEPGQLMLCKIWGFHGGDYEELKNGVFWVVTPCEPRRHHSS
jgi:hypothetical protein